MSNVYVVFSKVQDSDYLASVSMNDFLSSGKDLEPILKRAARIYGAAIEQMTLAIVDIRSYKKTKKKFLPARHIWELGDQIFILISNLEALGLQFDRLYEHLERDLNVKRKWLEKVIILRRYLPDINMIPESLNWGKCEKGTRRVAEQLLTSSIKR